MSDDSNTDYSNYVVYGPDANCTLALCPAELSVYQYRPSLAANDCLESILYLGPQYTRFRPKLYYWIFIPCDIFSLVLQAIGGALSSTSSGGSNAAVDVSITGLSLQVFFICVFVAFAVDYIVRYRKGQRVTPRTKPLSRSFKIFSYFLSLSIVLILIRCCYRIDELSDGYNGPLIHDEGLFIGLEGV
ncbi:MAG: hypothetical protein LQ352_004786 [Teloschistes flavicans]|nr:MAG: hypothetical protein LQ352_004786 [Teloschistes flavicans]